MEGPDSRRQEVLSWGAAATVGTNLVACLVVGAAIGFGLDRWLGTSPLMVAIWVLLGMGAGFRQLFRTVQRYGNDGNKR